MSNQHELFLALLAFQNSLIDEHALIAGFKEWIGNQQGELTSILVKRRDLLPEELLVLQSLANIYLKRHDNDVSKCLGSLNGIASVCRKLILLSQHDANTTQMISETLGSLATAEHLAQVDSADAKLSPESLGSESRFRIIRQHAQGGLGIVFVAEDKDISREVALKQMRRDLQSASAYESRFRLEAQITGQLEHPGIVPVYALGTDASGQPFYTMRFIRGEDLHSKILGFHQSIVAKTTRFEGQELRGLLRRFIDVCNAVHYAHDRGVLHRDLKPGNIMLGKYGETLVVDWGLAKQFQQVTKTIDGDFDPNRTQPILADEVDATRDGAVVGTPAFAPPEQLLGKTSELSPASDVYSLGAILYHLLTNRYPAEKATTFADLLRIVTNMDFKPPRLINTEVSHRLDAICMKAVKATPADRYQSAADLAREIENWLDDEPIAAYPDTVFERFSRWGRKNPSLCAALILVISLALSNIVLGIVIRNIG